MMSELIENYLIGRQTYIVIFVVEIQVHAPDMAPRYEENFTLLKASSQEEAEQKALDYVTNDACGEPYQNVYGEQVTWRLKKITEVRLILDTLELPTDIVELSTRAFNDYESYHNLFVRPLDSESET
jgi:hypothetical protein